LDSLDIKLYALVKGHISPPLVGGDKGERESSWTFYEAVTIDYNLYNARAKEFCQFHFYFSYEYF